jgi:hypothetical protein
MTALHPSDIDRFAKLLSLLGSDQIGERAAAAAKATEFLNARALGWFDVGEMLKHPPVVYQPAPVAPSRGHQQDARLCLQSGMAWKPHEREFLVQMAAQRTRPTEKQADWLDGLFDRAMRAGRR